MVGPSDAEDNVVAGEIDFDHDAPCGHLAQ
jgi:hypothetical protein